MIFLVLVPHTELKVKKANIVIVGATGNVGREMIAVLEERNFPIARLKLVASEKSSGKFMRYRGFSQGVEGLSKEIFHGYDIALFSAGEAVSRTWAPVAWESGCVVIDNSNAWRMDDEVPLVIPEVNPETIADYIRKGIIANPNCSTIQMVMALSPLDKNPHHYGIQNIIVSTYQSVSGAGAEAEARLAEGSHEFDVIPQIGEFLEGGTCEEEAKMIRETKKIMEKPHLNIVANTVRVPILRGHSEFVLFNFDYSYISIEVVKALLASAPCIKLTDSYPIAQDAVGTDYVLVGRVREEKISGADDNQKWFSMWVVADNIRKGAATNTVQIAELLWNGYLKKASD